MIGVISCPHKPSGWHQIVSNERKGHGTASGNKVVPSQTFTDDAARPTMEACGAGVRLANGRSNLTAGRHNYNWHGISVMSNDRSIIVTHRDLALLRALNEHAHLVSELQRADVVDSRDVPADVVTMNSRVVFEDVTRGTTTEVTIVFPQDADVERGKVSVLAPVGTALLGLAEGESIVWPFPDGSSRCLRVVAVTFQPEAEGSSAGRATAAHRPDDARHG
jgi:regulator of nucleoside diphosphate kinase